MTTQKDNPHITRKLTFQPELHRLCRSGLNPTGVKDVTRRMSFSGKVGDVVAMVTHWRTAGIINHILPVDLHTDGWRSGRIPFSFNSQPPCEQHIGKLRQARFFPRNLYHLCPLARIVSIRQEPVQAITEDDAINEGMLAIRSDEFDAKLWPEYVKEREAARASGTKPPIGFTPRQTFAAVWDHINGTNPAKAWASNPVVTRVEWEPVTDTEAKAAYERGSK